MSISHLQAVLMARASRAVKTGRSRMMALTSPPPSGPSEAWWLILLRHFTTVVAIIAGFWWLALPRVESFIQGAVNDRLVRVETSLDAHSRQLQSILERLAAVQKTQEDIINDGVSSRRQRQ